MSNLFLGVVVLIVVYAVWQFARRHIMTGVVVTVFCLVLPTTVYFFDLLRPFVNPGRVFLSVNELMDECTTWFQSMAVRGQNDKMREVEQSEEVRKALFRDAAENLQKSGQATAADRLLRQDEIVTDIVQESLREAAETRAEMSREVVGGYERQLASIQLDGAKDQSKLALKIADFALLASDMSTSVAETEPGLSESTEADKADIAFGQFCKALERGDMVAARRLMASETADTLSLSEVVRIRAILVRPFKVHGSVGADGDSIDIDLVIDDERTAMNCRLEEQDGNWRVADIDIRLPEK